MCVRLCIEKLADCGVSISREYRSCEETSFRVRCIVLEASGTINYGPNITVHKLTFDESSSTALVVISDKLGWAEFLVTL